MVRVTDAALNPNESPNNDEGDHYRSDQRSCEAGALAAYSIDPYPWPASHDNEPLDSWSLDRFIMLARNHASLNRAAHE